MSRDWESIFSGWLQGPSATEKQRAENAERQVRQVIAASPKLNARNIRVFTQGSYRNRVNVRRDSDVDVGVLCYDTFFYEIPDDNVKAQLQKSITPATYEYATFKRELGEALVAYFGEASVTKGNKAFDIKANTYRVEADVAPFFEHRRYTSAYDYHSGVEMIPDDLNPPRIKNWPEQHYDNGVMKNTNAARRYKRMVRVLKSLSNEMSRGGVQSAQNVPSFLVECLCWNTPNNLLCLPGYYQAVRETLVHLFQATQSDASCSEWGEVSELKYLFRPSQPWSRQSAHQFVIDAWNFVG